MKRSYLIIGILLLIISSILLWVFVFKYDKKDNTKLNTTVVARRDIGSTVLATGIIKPKVGAEVKVGSRISGVVKRLRANIGDFVKAGQIIAEIDDAELRAKLNQNIAAVNKAKADYDYAKLNMENHIWETQLLKPIILVRFTIKTQPAKLLLCVMYHWKSTREN